MANSDFSWRKVFSFVGAGLLVLVAFVTLAVGGNLLNMGQPFYGVMSLAAGVICFALAVVIYRNYQKWAKEKHNNKPNYTR